MKERLDMCGRSQGIKRDIKKLLLKDLQDLHHLEKQQRKSLRNSERALRQH